MRVSPTVTPNFSDGHRDTLWLSDPKPPSDFYDPHAYGRETAEKLLSCAQEMTDFFMKRDNGPNDENPCLGFVKLSRVHLDKSNPLGTSEPVSGSLTPESLEVTSQQPTGGLTGVWVNSQDGEIQDVTRVYQGLSALYADSYKLNPDGSCTVMDNVASLYG